MAAVVGVQFSAAPSGAVKYSFMSMTVTRSFTEDQAEDFTFEP